MKLKTNSKNEAKFNTMYEYMYKFELLDSPNNKEEVTEDECKHVLVFETGNFVCNKCGIVDIDKYQFITQNNDLNGYIEEYAFKPRSNQYNKLKHIRNDLVNYTITQQNLIDDETYKKYYDILIKSIPKKIIKNVLKDSNINFDNFYSKLSGTKPVYLNQEQINKICHLAEIFINKKLIKNLNRKAIVYAICKYEFNIDIGDYLSGLNTDVIEKYNSIYKEYKDIEKK